MNTTHDRLASKPLRTWLLAWRIHTGDSPEVIAKGFDLDQKLVADLLSGHSPQMMEFEEASEFCRRIRVDPGALWPQVAQQANLRLSEIDGPWHEIPPQLVRILLGRNSGRKFLR